MVSLGKIRDTANILSKVTPKRLRNMASVTSSYIFSRMMGKAYHSGLPSSISIEPTTSCNLRCPECPSGLRSFTRPTGMLSETVFQNVIDQLQSTLLYLTFYFQGEPYLNGAFLKMVKYASSKKIYTSTSTNGHYLDDNNCKQTIESGLDRLIVSIDGATQETYSSYRVGGSLEKVLSGVKNLNRVKKEMKSNTP
ncbi:MAG TPA: radical SAM protein, partial [Cytophagaceae bacterium]